MSWLYYSYLNLVSEKSFDCLSSLVCIRQYFKADAQKTATKGITVNFHLRFRFIPIATIYQGTKIRGDQLLSRSNYTFPSEEESSPGRYDLNIGTEARGATYTWRNDGYDNGVFPQSSISETGRIAILYHVTSYRDNRLDDKTSAVIYDPDLEVITYNVSINFSDMFKSCSARNGMKYYMFSVDMRNQSVGLANLANVSDYNFSRSYSASLVDLQDKITFPIETTTFDPITNPTHELSFVPSS